MAHFNTWQQFSERCNNRTVYVYGGNVEGVGVLRMLLSNGIRVGGVIDTRTFNQGFLRGQKVIHPVNFFDQPENSMIIICTKHRESRKDAIQFCIDRQYVLGEDYIFNSSLCQYYPTIELIGVCNLKCMTCDMGLEGANRNQKRMDLETFQKNLLKLKSEIPFLNSIALYLWDEPLMHPQIGEIVRFCHDQGVATEFSSNLNYIRNLESFIQADPDILVVTSSGFGKNYEVTHTGGDFQKFIENCQLLRTLIDRYKSEVFVRYHYLVYRHNAGQEMEDARAFAQSLGFQFVPILANIFPGKVHDHVVLGEPLPKEMVEVNKYLVYDIHDQIQWAQSQKDKPCPVIMAFPTIRWDGKVMQCCNMTKPYVGIDYLSHTLDELHLLRNDSGFCQRCQKHGMHRVFEVNGRDELKMSQLRDRKSISVVQEYT